MEISITFKIDPAKIDSIRDKDDFDIINDIMRDPTVLQDSKWKITRTAGGTIFSPIPGDAPLFDNPSKEI